MKKEGLQGVYIKMAPDEIESMMEAMAASRIFNKSEFIRTAVAEKVHRILKKGRKK